MHEAGRRIAADFSLHEVAMSNVLRREIAGASLEVGDLAIGRQRGTGDDRETDWTEQTVAYFVGAVRFPQFTLQPQQLTLKLAASAAGIDGYDFPKHPDVAQHYHLSAVHPANVGRLFDEGVLDHLRRNHGLRIQARGTAVLVYRPSVLCNPAQMEDFIAQATQAFRLLEASARRLQEARAAGLVPKSDPRAEAEKLGGLVGKTVRAVLVTHTDVDAFVQQLPPRKVPANIRRYCEEFAPALVVVAGAAFVIVGAVLLASFAVDGRRTGLIMALILLLVGVPLLWFFGRLRLRLERLLRYGKLATGKIEDIESAGGGLLVKVRFDAAGTTVQASGRIMGNTIDRVRKLREENKSAPLLYDPANPQRFVLTQALLTVSPEYDD